MLRVRASTLEKFRHLVVHYFVEQGEVINYVKAGQNGEQSLAMKVGSAWHKVLEDPTGTQVSDRQNGHDGILFHRDFVLRILQEIGPGEREKEYLKVFPSSSWGPVELKGTCDLVHGLEVSDFKTKVKSSPKVEDYERSLQWPVYLTLTGGFKFIYWLFPAEEPDEDGFVFIGEPMVFSFWRYDGMEDRVQEALFEFLQWADLHGLLPYLDKDFVLSKS